MAQMSFFLVFYLFKLCCHRLELQYSKTTSEEKFANIVTVDSLGLDGTIRTGTQIVWGEVRTHDGHGLER